MSMLSIGFKSHVFIWGKINVRITFPHVSNAIDLASLLPPRPSGDKKIIPNTFWEIISKDANPKKVATIDQWIDLIFAGIPAKSNELLK